MKHIVMKTFILATITALIVCGCHTENPATFSEKEAAITLLAEKEITPALLAKVVNHFVTEGEEAAVKELHQLAAKGGADGSIGLVCRILFQPKGDSPLRDARYGALMLPYNSMPLKSWPVFPLAQSGDSYFVLAQGRMLAGFAEPASKYISYCQTNGIFLKKPLPIPTREKAIEDAKALRASPEWKAIKWKDSGQGFSYEYSETSIWDEIKKQAESIP